MNQSTYNSLKSFIWGIANDCLVDVYDVDDELENEACSEEESDEEA